MADRITNAEVEIESLKVRMTEVERRVRLEEKWTDTRLETPLWKRMMFAVDGWPWTRLVENPQWRPWRRWWRS